LDMKRQLPDKNQLEVL